jgi:hypothetical protein
MKDAFEGKIPDLGETRQVVIIQGGRLVYEQYAAEYGPDMRLISWSSAARLGGFRAHAGTGREFEHLWRRLVARSA